jgi:DNA modification methylase
MAYGDGENVKEKWVVCRRDEEVVEVIRFERYSSILLQVLKEKYRVITNDVSEYINLLVRN